MVLTICNAFSFKPPLWAALAPAIHVVQTACIGSLLGIGGSHSKTTDSGKERRRRGNTESKKTKNTGFSGAGLPTFVAQQVKLVVDLGSTWV